MQLIYSGFFFISSGKNAGASATQDNVRRIRRSGTQKMLTEIVLSDMLRNVTNVCTSTRRKRRSGFSWPMEFRHVKEIRRYGPAMERCSGKPHEEGKALGLQNPFVTNQSLRKDKIVIAAWTFNDRL